MSAAALMGQVLGICGPLNYPRMAVYASDGAICRGEPACHSYVSKVIQGRLEHEMRSNWPSDATAPR